MLKKIMIALGIFCFYHVFFFTVQFIHVMSQPTAWDFHAPVLFGNQLRVRVLERSNGNILADFRPEDKMKGTLLDRHVYRVKTESDIFYRDKVLYSLGSAGFYVIYAEPYKIKVYQNPNQPVSERMEIDKSLSKYGENELKVVSQISDFNKEERKVYKEMAAQAEKDPQFHRE